MGRTFSENYLLKATHSIMGANPARYQVSERAESPPVRTTGGFVAIYIGNEFQLEVTLSPKHPRRGSASVWADGTNWRDVRKYGNNTKVPSADFPYQEVKHRKSDISNEREREASEGENERP